GWGPYGGARRRRPHASLSHSQFLDRHHRGNRGGRLGARGDLLDSLSLHGYAFPRRRLPGHGGWRTGVPRRDSHRQRLTIDHSGQRAYTGSSFTLVDALSVARSTCDIPCSCWRISPTRISPRFRGHAYWSSRASACSATSTGDYSVMPIIAAR